MAKTANEIAQWVIDNRYPKSENNKISDFEMYHQLVNNIEDLCNSNMLADVNDCSTCKYRSTSQYVDPCYRCENYSNFIKS